MPCNCDECRIARGEQPLPKLPKDEAKREMAKLTQELAAHIERLKKHLPNLDIMVCAHFILPSTEGDVEADVFVPTFAAKHCPQMAMPLMHMHKAITDACDPFQTKVRTVNIEELLGRFGG